MNVWPEYEQVQGLIERRRREKGDAWLKHFLGDLHEKIERIEKLSSEELTEIASKII